MLLTDLSDGALLFLRLHPQCFAYLGCLNSLNLLLLIFPHLHLSSKFLQLDPFDLRDCTSSLNTSKSPNTSPTFMIIFEAITFKFDPTKREDSLILHLMLAVHKRMSFYMLDGKIPSDWIQRLSGIDKCRLYCSIDKQHKDSEAEFDWSNADIETPELVLASADVWMFGDVKSKAWKKYYCDLSLAIACMAFCPGGIQVFGFRIEGSFD